MALRCPTEGHRQEWSLRLNSIEHGWCCVAVLSWWSHFSCKCRFPVYGQKEESRRGRRKMRKRERERARRTKRRDEDEN